MKENKFAVKYQTQREILSGQETIQFDSLSLTTYIIRFEHIPGRKKLRKRMKEARSMYKWRNGKMVIMKKTETEVWDKWRENDFT
jgi:hypothetical protein